MGRYRDRCKWLGIFALVLLAGCFDDIQQGDEVFTGDFNYRIVDSGGNLNTIDGRKVAVIHGTLDNSSCSDGVIVNFSHTADATLTTSGSVDVSFFLNFSGEYLETIYIDMDASNNLNSGDLVWGTLSSSWLWLCRDSSDYTSVANITIDWSGEVSGQTIVYTGIDHIW